MFNRDILADQVFAIMPTIHKKLIKKFKSRDFKRSEVILLHHLQTKDGLAMHTYGEHLCMSKPNLSKLVNELEGKNWVKKEKSKEDKRVTHLFLTDLGKTVLNDHHAAAKKQVKDSTSVLTDEEIETLISNFQSINEILAKLDDHEDWHK